VKLPPQAVKHLIEPDRMLAITLPGWAWEKSLKEKIERQLKGGST
jgi:hypothetical protein